MLKFESNSDP